MYKTYFFILSAIIFLSCNTDREKYVYSLVGQSNMAGRGTLEAVDTTMHNQVFMFSKDTQWIPAKEPMRFYRPERVGVGLGFAFGRKMAENNPDVDIYLIPCAVGGTPIETWEKGVLHEITGAYPYDQAIARAKKALKVGKLKGILWHQGESDSKPERYPFYEKRLEDLMKRFRKDLDADSVPIIVGEIGRFHAKRRPFYVIV